MTMRVVGEKPPDPPRLGETGDNFENHERRNKVKYAIRCLVFVGLVVGAALFFAVRARVGNGGTVALIIGLSIIIAFAAGLLLVIYTAMSIEQTVPFINMELQRARR